MPAPEVSNVGGMSAASTSRDRSFPSRSLAGQFSTALCSAPSRAISASTALPSSCETNTTTPTPMAAKVARASTTSSMPKPRSPLRPEFI
jgi:hypothetical protein